MINRVFMIGTVHEILQAATWMNGHEFICTLITEKSEKSDVAGGSMRQRRQLIHKIVARKKIGEICSKYIQPGKVVNIEGHLEYEEGSRSAYVELNSMKIIRVTQEVT